jgi:hypothetical protein
VRGSVAGDGGRAFDFVAARWQQDWAARCGRQRARLVLNGTMRTMLRGMLRRVGDSSSRGLSAGQPAAPDPGLADPLHQGLVLADHGLAEVGPADLADRACGGHGQVDRLADLRVEQLEVESATSAQVAAGTEADIDTGSSSPTPGFRARLRDRGTVATFHGLPFGRSSSGSTPVAGPVHVQLIKYPCTDHLALDGP